jgi:hypothetical protein
MDRNGNFGIFFDPSKKKEERSIVELLTEANIPLLSNRGEKWTKVPNSILPVNVGAEDVKNLKLPAFLFVFMPGCSHCHRATPAVLELANKIKEEADSNGYMYGIYAMNSDDYSNQKFYLANIRGYPFFAIIDKGGYIHQYDKTRIAVCTSDSDDNCNSFWSSLTNPMYKKKINTQ